LFNHLPDKIACEADRDAVENRLPQQGPHGCSGEHVEALIEFFRGIILAGARSFKRQKGLEVPVVLSQRCRQEDR
jgi:hypothetical protein